MEVLDQMDASVGDPKTKATRPRKAKSADRSSSKRRLALSLPREDVEKLTIHALKLDCDLSTLVSRLIREGCRDYHLVRSPTKGEGERAAG